MRNLILGILGAGVLTAAILYASNGKEQENDILTSEQMAQAEREIPLYAEKFEADIRVGELAEKTNRTIDTIVRRANKELKKRGHKKEAAEILTQWETVHYGFVVKMQYTRDIGDHPGIQWMISVHDKIESLIGETICKALRLHDIYTLAYTIPVVFQCVDNVDSEEYKLHFVPFLGICSYWISWGVCVGATFGTGAAFICGFIGMGVEQLTIRVIAPKISDKAWSWSCEPNLQAVPFYLE